MLVTTPPPGPARSRHSTPDAITDETLAAAGSELRRAPRGRASATATSTAPRILVDDDGELAFDDFSSADASGEQYWRNRDVRRVLVATRRCSSATTAPSRPRSTALGKERVGEVIPFVQPAALPARHDRGRQAPRQGAEGAARRAGDRHRRRGRPAAQDQAAQPGEHRHARRHPARARDRDPEPRGRRLGHRSRASSRTPTWGWAVLALVLYPLIPMAWAHRAHGLRQQGPAVRPRPCSRSSRAPS